MKRKEIVLFTFHISTYFSLADEFNHGSRDLDFERMVTKYSATGTKNLVDKKIKKERDGKRVAEGCAISSRMYATRIILCDVYARRSHRSLPSGNNAFPPAGM